MPRFLPRDGWLAIFGGIFIVGASFVAYQPVMHGFFIADDFDYISRFHAMRHGPMQFFQQSLRHLECGLYYRPVTINTLYCEYLLWGATSQCFRLMSLVCQLVTLGIMYLLIAEFAYSSKDQSLLSSQRTWWLFSAGLFALYPLHTEPIDWIVGQTEILANFLVLLSFWFYLRWRRQSSWYLELFSCLFAACAFLTKEATVALPAVLVAYELLAQEPIAGREYASPEGSQRFLLKLKQYVRNVIFTSWHWLLLIVYFCLRRMILGTFTGSWAKKGFYFADISTMLVSWKQSLKAILIPFSSPVFNAMPFADLLWIAMLLALTSITVFNVRNNRKQIMLSLFMIAWFIICLVPMHGVLLITSDLTNARYGYSASVPLCCLLGLGLASNSYLKRRPYVLSALFVLVLSFSCFILRQNNQAWAAAGQLTNNLVCEFRRIHENVTGDPLIYIFNVPSRFKGVPIEGMDVAGGMNRLPFAQRNFRNCILVGSEGGTLPIRSMNSSSKSNTIQATFYSWHMDDQRLHEIDFAKLKSLTFSEKTSDLGTPNIVSGKRTILSFSPNNLECWPADVIVLQVTLKSPKTKNNARWAELSYTNDLKNTASFEECVIAPLRLDVSTQTLIFPLRGIPTWAFGGHCREVRIAFPKAWIVRFENAYTASAENLMPKLKLAGHNYVESLGQVDLGPSCPENVLEYDASFIKGCAGVVFEAVHSGEYFRELNTPRSDAHTVVELTVMQPSGSILLNRSMFGSMDTYKLRLRPIDGQGNQVGLCSDHFLVAVSK